MASVTIDEETWAARVANVKVSKADLNKLVMNYLVVEGYKDAAAAFVTESGESAGTDLEAVANRMKIRQALREGNVTNAMELTNDLNPETLDTSPQLFFRLQLQRLIELIRTGNVEAALDFAEHELAPLTDRNPTFLAELEETMALFAFPDQSQSPVGHLLSPAQRQKIASELNAAILASQSEATSPRLPSLLKLLQWAQEKLKTTCDFPVAEFLNPSEDVDSAGAP
eukprot:m.169150 g.169150  ORF g.169150 m.169150 type:complete len:227 (+) comp18231_c0_seq1:220-900(+)